MDIYRESNITSDLATHGGGQIGIGSNAPPEHLMENVFNDKAQNTYTRAVSKWIDSPLHNANMRWEADYMAVAVLSSCETGFSWTRESTSIIVTFGTQGTEHYFIDGKDMGVFNPDTAPLYGYSVRYADGDSVVSKETTVSKVGAPYEKWDEYLNSYKTVR